MGGELEDQQDRLGRVKAVEHVECQVQEISKRTQNKLFQPAYSASRKETENVLQIQQCGDC